MTLKYLSPLSVSQEVFTGVVYSLTALYIVSMTIFGGITAVLCWKIHALKRKGNPLITLYPSVCTSKWLMHTLALLLILGIHEDSLCIYTYQVLFICCQFQDHSPVLVMLKVTGSHTTLMIPPTLVTSAP